MLAASRLERVVEVAQHGRDRATVVLALEWSVARIPSIADIWQGEKYEAFRAALASDTPPEICRSCAVYRGTF